MADAAFIDALAYYRTKFPTLASLGDGNPPAAWLEEYESVAPAALDAITGTAVSLESGNVSGQINFRQIHKVRALHARRAELDTDYANPYTQPAPEPMQGKRLGHRVRIGHDS